MSRINLKDFYSEWCAPCKDLSPIIDELSQEYETVKFEKIDIEEKEEKAEEYNIRAIPAIIIECDGDVKQKFVGFQTKETLAGALDKIINEC